MLCVWVLLYFCACNGRFYLSFTRRQSTLIHSIEYNATMLCIYVVFDPCYSHCQNLIFLHQFELEAMLLFFQHGSSRLQETISKIKRDVWICCSSKLHNKILFSFKRSKKASSILEVIEIFHLHQHFLLELMWINVLMIGLRKKNNSI